MDHNSQFDRITAHLKPTLLERFSLLTIDRGVVEKALRHFNATCDHDADRSMSSHAITLMMADDMVLRIMATAVDHDDKEVFDMYHQCMKDRIHSSAVYLCTMMSGARSRLEMDAAMELIKPE